MLAEFGKKEVLVEHCLEKKQVTLQLKRTELKMSLCEHRIT